MSGDLERLRDYYHPDIKVINVVEQARIVAEAFAPGGEYEEDIFSLYTYLGVCRSQVYRLDVIHKDMLPKVKVWFRETKYKVNTAFMVASKSPEGQLEFLRNETEKSKEKTR